MIRRFTRLGLAAAAIGLIATGTAFATPIEMKVTVGTESHTYMGVTPGALPGESSSVTLPGWPSAYSIGGWSIATTKTSGDTYSPYVTPLAIDLAAFTASCSGSSCQPLTIAVSANDFQTPIGMGGFETTLGNTQTGGGSVTQWAYADQGNMDFATTDLIGTLSVSGSGSKTVYGLDTGVTGPYSLTLIDTFNSCTVSKTTDTTVCGSSTFSVDNNIAATPEPGTLALFGAGLLGCAMFVERRRRASQSRV